ncbi:hypothetical protein PTTG_26105 [Puccinia triticina 1-1 BBBD Race 1]|uniref:Uncharacterized protein n=1 Tax=Puccinia triticina (isolate 1-1 / race 1 (BBBD)) TaxID=630390 RepID=A0A180GWS9_PUCT1|nr:hypothetical protein PTTG_26105 [Puccinia triticina 1-1 BBBD Race 1]
MEMSCRKIYAGTGTLNTSFARGGKHTFSGKFGWSEASQSVRSQLKGCCMDVALRASPTDSLKRDSRPQFSESGEFSGSNGLAIRLAKRLPSRLNSPQPSTCGESAPTRHLPLGPHLAPARTPRTPIPHATSPTG